MLRQWLDVAPSDLAEWVTDARRRTVELAADLTDAQLMGPRLPIVNPLLWEIGHMAWFQEKWVLRHVCGEPPIRGDGDALYDSSAIPHDARWDLPLPAREATLAYAYAVRDRVLDKLRAEPHEQLVYHVLYSVFHEDMHTEAFTYTRQTLAYPAPRFSDAPSAIPRTGGGPLPGDAPLPGGALMLGAAPNGPFAFDNEKWAHPVEVRPFAIARAPVTQAEFAAFVENDGYRRREWWSDDGWRWRERAEAQQPVYWRRAGRAWSRRNFDRWVPLEPDRPVVHVNWYEADAYCRWAGRRLPTEAEWELAAAAEVDPERLELTGRKRRFPWGDSAPTPAHANLDWRGMGCVDVGAFSQGDSPAGCRQLIGNVWEWTSSTFLPYPGFIPDPYREYSEPWFGQRKVLRGGSWATRSRLIWNTWRNYFTPERRDVWAGFRTCPVQA